ncbi:unnamed protein product [Spirodela intermedia]|uniref:Uncharacterized protein n=1 Tax=Spirodela intermedia TaxID=51605 RepID=A0A7I8KHP9_SPIIN|nr:unnamed protein product [Spirodela intermedia]
MDFVEGLPKSKGFDSILVVMDCLSKYIHFSPSKHLFAINRCGSRSIFTSAFWKELHALQGTLLKMSFAYHPKMDGQMVMIKTSPFQVVYGIEPQPSTLRVNSVPLDEMDHMLAERDASLELLKSHLSKVQASMKKEVDQHRHDM